MKTQQWVKCFVCSQNLEDVCLCTSSGWQESRSLWYLAANIDYSPSRAHAEDMRLPALPSLSSPTTEVQFLLPLSTLLLDYSYSQHTHILWICIFTYILHVYVCMQTCIHTHICSTVWLIAFWLVKQWIQYCSVLGTFALFMYPYSNSLHKNAQAYKDQVNVIKVLD